VALEVDHAIARSNNGKDTMDNYVTACDECNKGKANRNYVKVFSSWDEEVISLVVRYREYRNLLNLIKQNGNAVLSELKVLLNENMAGYKIIDNKTGEVLNDSVM